MRVLTLSREARAPAYYASLVSCALCAPYFSLTPDAAHPRHLTINVSSVLHISIRRLMQVVEQVPAGAKQAGWLATALEKAKVPPTMSDRPQLLESLFKEVSALAASYVHRCQDNKLIASIPALSESQWTARASPITDRPACQR